MKKKVMKFHECLGKGISLWRRLACFLLAALSSVLRMKGVDRVGDCSLLRYLEQLEIKMDQIKGILENLEKWVAA